MIQLLLKATVTVEVLMVKVNNGYACSWCELETEAFSSTGKWGPQVGIPNLPKSKCELKLEFQVSKVCFIKLEAFYVYVYQLL